MQTVYDLGNGMRLVDLSKLVDPATETRRCKLFRFNTGGPIPDFHTNVDIMTHLGTHAECPYHHNDNWPDVTGVPLTTFVGRAVYVNFHDSVAPNTHITAADLDRAASKVREGDIVIIDSDYKLNPFTKDTNTEKDKRLFVNAENCNEDVKPFHDILLAENIIFIEVLKNLELLQKDVFFMSYAPLPIVGLDSSPVHAYAIEGIKEFSED